MFDTNIFHVGDEVVIISEPLNHDPQTRSLLLNKGGIITKLGVIDNAEVIVEGRNAFLIWLPRLRKATPKEKRSIRLIHTIHYGTQR